MSNTPLHINRRELLGTVVASLLAREGFARQSANPEFAALDHIEFYVSNVEKSRDFFVKVFGNTLKNRNGKRYLKLGSTYMAFEAPRGNSGIRVDHFSVAVKRLDMPKLHAFLEQRGVMFQDYPSGRDTGITDSDGIRTQLSPEDGWSFLNTPNFPGEEIAVRDEPMFHPIGLNHILLNVADLEKSTAFYQRFLGSSVDRNNGRIWFQAGMSRIGLMQTLANERPGVHHFCISAAAFDYNSAVSKLQQSGAGIERAETPGVVQFRDLDGLRIQIAQQEK
jgi:catechol 2,3-dioxygenase-like lactoylglutathione lyase family enzyme